MARWKLFCSFQVLVGAFCASTGTAASTASSCVEIVDTETRMTKTEQTRLWTQSQRNSNFSNRARRASETQRVRMSHGLHWFPISEFAQEIPRDLMNGLRENYSRWRRGARRDEVLADLDLTCAADPGIELGWEAGILCRRFPETPTRQ